MMRLDGRAAVVTGAAQGIGQAIAHRLAEAGARQFLVDIKQEPLEELAASLRDAYDVEVVTHVADLVPMEGVRGVIPRVHETLGALHILVNNAGIFPARSIEEITTEEFDKVIEINLRAPLFLGQAALADLRAAGRQGRLINISSGAAKTGAQGAHYAASKAGVLAMTNSFASALGPSGATANAICPGPTLTDDPVRWSPDIVAMLSEKIPLGRLGEAMDVANAVWFLASDLASYITGEVLDVNGGMRMD